MPPKTSCVTFPTPPIGLMSVSPSDRAATAASTADKAIAMSVSYQAIPNTVLDITTVTIDPAINPPIHQLLGIASRSDSDSTESAGRNVSARTKVRHERPSDVSASQTMSATPGQRIQP